MYYIREGGKRKILHTEECKHKNAILEQNLGSFHDKIAWGKSSPRPIFYRSAEIVTFWDTPPVLSKNFLISGIEKNEIFC